MRLFVGNDIELFALLDHPPPLGNSRDFPIRRKSVVLENRGHELFRYYATAAWRRELLAPPRRSCRSPVAEF
jgi:hypothetical protein